MLFSSNIRVSVAELSNKEQFLVSRVSSLVVEMSTQGAMQYCVIRACMLPLFLISSVELGLQKHKQDPSNYQQSDQSPFQVERQAKKTSFIKASSSLFVLLPSLQMKYLCSTQCT